MEPTSRESFITEDKAPDVSDELIADFFKTQFSQSGNVEVESVKHVEPNTFEIETKGSTAVRGWQHEPRLFFGALPLAFLRTSLGGVFTLSKTI